MNKLFTKIATLGVGLAMAIGVGVAVGVKADKNVELARASSTEQTMTWSSFSSSNTYGMPTTASTTPADVEDETHDLTLTVNNLKINSGYLMVYGATGYVYNKDPIPGYITGVTVTFNTGSVSTAAICTIGLGTASGSGLSGASKATTQSAGGNASNASGVTTANKYRYFSIGSTKSSKNLQITNITVVYEPIYIVTYDKNDSDASGTMTDSNSPYLVNSTVTVLGNSFTAPSGKMFSSWNTKANGTGTTKNPADTFTITADTTLYAQWEELSDDPYVIISSPIAGYTGQEPDVSFSYGNFTSTLSITSSDEDVVEISNIDIADPSSSTVTLSYVGAGSADVYFKDGVGGTTITTLAVTVTQTAITGMPSTNSVKMGETLNLGALVSVNVGGLTWNSTVPEKATVDSSGVVTPVAIGTTTITVTSAVDSSVSASCTVTVEKASPAVTDEITRSDLDFGSSTGYSNFTTSKSSKATYVGQAYQTATGYIQIRTSGSVEGLVSTATGGKRVKSVTIDFNKSSNAIQIYGNNNAYSGSNAANLFSNTESVKGTMVQEIEYSESAVTYTFTSDYKYIGIRSKSGAAYLDSVSIIWELYSADEVASNIKTMAGGWNNDTETNQCGDHYQTAKEMILLMSSSELDDFKTNNEDNDIKSARATYEWWCHINGDDSPWSGAIVQNAKGNFTNFAIGEKNSATIIIIVISVVSLTAVGGYFLLKKKKEQ